MKAAKGSKMLMAAACVLAVLWLLSAAAFLLEARHAVNSPVERDYGEGIVLWQAAHVGSFATAYHPIDRFPHIVFHYPPVYHVLARAAAVLTGDLLAAGRLVSILCYLASSLMLSWLAWSCLAVCRYSGARLFGAACAGLVGFTMTTCVWGCLMRVDAAAAAFTVAGLCCFIRSRKRPALAYLAFTLFVVALYTKQVVIEAPLVCLIAAYIENRRLAGRLLTFAVSLGLVIMLTLNWASGGFFFVNLFRYNQNPYTIAHLFSEWNRHVAPSFVVPLAVAVIAGLALFTSAKGPPLRLIRRYLTGGLAKRCALIFFLYLIAALVMTLTVGKEGSNTNYFMQVDIAISLLSAICLGWSMDQAARNRRQYAGILAVAMGGLLFAALPAIGSVAYAASDGRQSSADAALTDVVRHLNGTVYSENMTILIRAGKDVPAEPAIITCLAKAHAWDESGFVSRIREGQFAGVLVATSLDNRERFTPAVAAAIRERYPSVREFGFYKLYLPAHK